MLKSELYELPMETKRRVIIDFLTACDELEFDSDDLYYFEPTPSEIEDGALWYAYNFMHLINNLDMSDIEMRRQWFDEPQDCLPFNGRTPYEMIMSSVPGVCAARLYVQAERTSAYREPLEDLTFNEDLLRLLADAGLDLD